MKIVLFLGSIILLTSVTVTDTLAFVGQNDVLIGKTGIGIPIGRMLLIRNDEGCWAFKFIKVWQGETEKEDHYADYEIYQTDVSGDFTKKSVMVKKGELSCLRPRGIHPFVFQLGKPDISVGSNKLLWVQGTTVHFFGGGQDQADYGVELAPTIWTDISQVDVSDKRVEWYRYDACRKDLTVPIEHLWDEKREVKTPEDVHPELDEALITSGSISMPVGKILLVRKKSMTGAVKFKKFWCNEKRYECSGCCESYYQGDKSEVLSPTNYKFRNRELILGWLPRTLKKERYSRDIISCGEIRLLWTGNGTVRFGDDPKEGDPDIELAPTKWTDISQIDVSDKRIKWYRYDEKRKDIIIPVDKLWDDNFDKK